MNSFPRKLLIAVLLACCLNSYCFGQQIDLGIKNYKTSVESPYRLDLKKDLIVSGVSLALIGTGYFLKGFRTALDTTDVTGEENLAAIDKIPSFDRSTIHNYDNTFVTTSDVLLFTSMALPFISFFDKRVNGHAPQIIAMYFETLAINEAIHTMVTSTANRRRTYTFNTDSVPVYNPETGQTKNQPVVSIDAKLKKGNLNSFFSGHTSTAAAATFFGATIFTDFRPHSKLIPFVWGVAAVVPAFTAYARVKAGRHFPSDVVTGYIVGASIGYLVPTLHKFKGKDLSMSPWFNGQGITMDYSF